METHASGQSEVIISYKSQPLSDFRLLQITSEQDHLTCSPVWVDIWHSRLREATFFLTQALSNTGNILSNT